MKSSNVFATKGMHIRCKRIKCVEKVAANLLFEFAHLKLVSSEVSAWFDRRKGIALKCK